ncbi:HAMP domain-containing protein [Actinomadura sp. LD22]|uniref:histidine kinase n=1 Tax=Actinomadura physcomitrii TaxID=2650748 RepID=A0A6I4M6W0_9ACTN|nr:sensor histidine kinase [Actinomadura physcomitrii]MVZ99896.1 HAMP domain-containing protein [Actinomadura physcomitrii]
MSKNGNGRRAAKRVRRRPVGRRIGFLLLLPLASLLALWAFAAVISLKATIARSEFNGIVYGISRPIGLMGYALQAERTAAVAALASPGPQAENTLRTRQQATDAALIAFRRQALPKASDRTGDRTRELVSDLGRRYEGLPALRKRIEARSITPLEAIQQYSGLFDGTNAALSDLVKSDDTRLYQTTQTLVDTNWARDYMLREDALLTATRARGGRFSPTEYAAFVQAAANRDHLSERTFNGPSQTVRDAYRAMVRSPQYTRFQQLEQKIVASPARRLPPAVLAEWSQVMPPTSQAWWENAVRATDVLGAENKSAGREITVQLVLVCGFGLLVVVASVVLSGVLGRDIARDLRNLQGAAQELARSQLPEVVARLRRGEKVSVADEAPDIGAGRTAEIASLAEAFTTVQRTAIETAVGEAQVRAGVSRVFINLAWRSQSLLHRQLQMLDAMERGTSDPDELENLFRLDHLTTRMRRHAEGLVILSGNQNVRGWSEPVAAEQLLRAALAEVEEYARVDVMALAPTLVSGAVVADVVHLLAELIENATSFSPPTTEVLVRAERVGNGLAIEVIDRGVGLEPGDLTDINARLADPPEFDLADSDRLGLFIVARLAQRHGIKVVLQPSAYGGVTAVVLLPPALLTSSDSPQNGEQGMHSQVSPPPAEQGRVPHEAPPAQVPAGNRTLRRPIDGRHRAPDAPAALPLSPTRSSSKPRPDAVTAETPASPGGDEVEEYDVETGGLPRRARQRHLAPQLQRRRARTSTAGGRAEPGDRPAEQNRDLLSSLQAGWTAGRRDDEHRSAVFEDPTTQQGGQ